MTAVFRASQYELAAARVFPTFVARYPRLACNPGNAEAFFPDGEIGSRTAEKAAARLCLGACPAQRECLAWALETRQAFGVWGGKTPIQRSNILKKRGLK